MAKLEVNSPDARSAPLLEIRDLTIGVLRATRLLPVVEGISLRVNRGEIVALVGESGSGKSLTALATMRLLPSGLEILSGQIKLAGRDVRALGPRELNRVRGAEIAMLFQQPAAMLDPTARVGAQVSEALRRHSGVSQRVARSRVLELFAEVGIPDPEIRIEAYAHELSGGMAQRVMLAAALSANPSILIADEPTTALDVTIQVQILKLIRDRCRARNMGVLMITHDLGVVAALADQVAVMYAGRVVEFGPTSRLLASPLHPYTQGLIRSAAFDRKNDGRLYAIRGSGANAAFHGIGCRFQPRCDICSQYGERCLTSEPQLLEHEDGVSVRCWTSPSDIERRVVGQ